MSSMVGHLKRRAVEVLFPEARSTFEPTLDSRHRSLQTTKTDDNSNSRCQRRRLCQLSSLPRGAVQLGEEIGRGRFGVVRAGHLLSYSEATLSYSSRQVAVKSLPAGQWEAGRREIAAMASVSGHPNIVGMRGWSRDSQGGVHIVMEKVCGGELFTFINAHGRLSERRAAAIMRQLADATAFCHLSNILHRDLKPENVLLMGGKRGVEGEGEREGEGQRRGVAHGDECECDTCYPVVKIADFGLAVRMKSPEGEGRREGEGEGEGELYGLAGSPLYMAPEVALSQRYGPKADVWSLGVILYVLLCGSAPLYGKTEAESLRAAQSGHVDFSHSLWRQLAPEAVALLRRMLSRDATKRPTAAQVLSHPWVTPRGGREGREGRASLTTTPLSSEDWQFWEREVEEERRKRERMEREKVAVLEAVRKAKEEEEREVLRMRVRILVELAHGMMTRGSMLPPLEPLTEAICPPPPPPSFSSSFSQYCYFSGLPPERKMGEKVDSNFGTESDDFFSREFSGPELQSTCDTLSQASAETSSFFRMSPKTPFDFLHGKKESNLIRWDDILLGDGSLYI